MEGKVFQMIYSRSFKSKFHIEVYQYKIRDLKKMFGLCEKQSAKIAGFIKKLYKILNTSQYSHVICWADDGKSIKIVNFKELENLVLESNFRHRNYHSFIRQLNMYGFHKMEKNLNTTAAFFIHPLFQKGCSDNLPFIKTKHQIRRLEIEQKQSKLQDINSQKMMENIINRRISERNTQILEKLSFQKVFKTCSENIFRPVNFNLNSNLPEIPKIEENKNLVKPNQQCSSLTSTSSFHDLLVDGNSEERRNLQNFEKNTPTKNGQRITNFNSQTDSLNGNEPEERKTDDTNSNTKSLALKNAPSVQLEKGVQFVHPLCYQNAQIPMLSYFLPQQQNIYNNQANYGIGNQAYFSAVLQNGGFVPVSQNSYLCQGVFDQMMVPYQGCQTFVVNGVF